MRNIFKNTEKSTEENKRRPLSAFRLSRAARTHGLLNLKALKKDKNFQRTLS